MSVLQINNGGEPIGIIEYDTASDSLVIRGQNGRTVTIDSATAAAWAPPVGAAYIQFPGLDDPGALWPGTTWQKMFDDEGVFFRTEGGEALAFDGGIQDSANKSHTHKVTEYYMYNNGTQPQVQYGSNGWLQRSTRSPTTTASGTTEARSKNRTFRVWERIS